MGFWKAVGKIIQGKPVFETPDQSVDRPPTLESLRPAPLVRPASQVEPPPEQPKPIPTVSITHCKTHVHGNDMTVTAWVTNTSDTEIELDKVTLLDAKTEIDRRLSPHQGHEVMLYKGPAPTTDAARKTCLYYKCIPTGDYFCADFSTEYTRESDGKYIVEDLHHEHYGSPGHYGVREISPQL